MTDSELAAGVDTDADTDSIEGLREQSASLGKSRMDLDATGDADDLDVLELPGADLGELGELAIRVLPQQRDEFTCTSCFLVRHRSQRADGDCCRDCE